MLETFIYKSVPLVNMPRHSKCTYSYLFYVHTRAHIKLSFGQSKTRHSNEFFVFQVYYSVHG